ncbi:hypothetical protein [Alphaspiravirus yamagawaense]|uniref:Uncharacterized protein n=1 Tax=Alphaspiravirus yamagawaense TaxID=1157339 RepID=J7QC76_9VIRU|nr:hypothetical protein [Aeropyrum coil-shaped virus]CCG27859.1 hypothetical protein [Aeropyrum coil-shaped virus]
MERDVFCVVAGKGYQGTSVVGATIVCYRTYDDTKQITIKATKAGRTMGGRSVWRMWIEGRPETENTVFIRRATEEELRRMAHLLFGHMVPK